MRRLPLMLASFVLCLSAPSLSCKREAGESTRPGARGPKMPEPLELPANPAVGLWIASPQSLLDYGQTWSERPLVPREAVGALIESQVEGLEAELASEINAGVNFAAPVAAAYLPSPTQDEWMIRVGLSSEAREQLAIRFEGYEKIGEFGAVKLPLTMPLPAGSSVSEPEGQENAPPVLAWLDDDFLALGSSPAALVTSRELKASYGERPVWAHYDVTQSGLADDPVLGKLRFELVGQPRDATLHVWTPGPEVPDPSRALPLADGTLSGLFEDPQLGLGLTGSYADYDDSVQRIIAEVEANVAQLPFFIKGVAEDLQARLNATLRRWDGRALVAAGPDSHLRIALGTDDAVKFENATVRLLRAIADNLGVLRNFNTEIPELTMARNIEQAGGLKIHRLSVRGMKNTPKQAAVFLRKGALELAMAWNPRAGGGMFVVGPDSVGVLSRWIEASAKGASGEDTRAELAAAISRVPPLTLGAAIEKSARAEIKARAEGKQGGTTAMPEISFEQLGPPYTLVASRDDKGLHLHYTHPE